tara:strand:+ start:132 stop:683 length:552 start_codon:yes stop_codon:yes gene_type:complete
MGKLKIVIYIYLFMFAFLSKTIADNSKNFFDFSLNDINDEKLEMSSFKGNPILLVNVASYCGFTNQYKELQLLYDKYKNKGLIVIGLPSNQFGGQEPGSNDEIKDFCEVNFNITFPMTSKYDVKGENAHPIYLWAKESFGNSAIPKWNFHKILINKDGKIEDTFSSFTKPMSKKIISKIEKIL